MASIIPILKKSYLLSDTQIGRLSTLFMIGYVAACPFFGFFGDRLKKKEALLICAVLVWSTSNFLTGFATSYGQLAFYRTLVGIGQAGFSILAPSILADHFSREKQNSILSFFYTAIPLGSAFGFITGGYLSSFLTLNKVFIYSSLPCFIILIAYLLFGHHQFKSTHTESTGNIALNDIPAIFKIKEYLFACLGYCAYNYALGTIAFWGPTLLLRKHHIDNENASIIFGTLLVVMGISGTLIGGAIANKFKKHYSNAYTIICFSSMLLSVPFCLLALFQTNYDLALLNISLGMFFAFFITGPVNTLIMQSSPEELKTSAFAISVILIHILGDMWSAESIGRLLDLKFEINIALLLLPIFFLVAAFLWIFPVLSRNKQGMK